jgi:hypothetical protein
VIALWLPDPEQRDSRCVDRQAQKSKAEIPMRQKMYLSALVAASLIGASCSALAQNTGAAAGAQVAPGMGGVPPVGTAPPSAGTTTTNPGSAGISSAPGGSSTTTTGIGSGGVNQPGVPNTSTPGIIGTGASPSGLPGDDPAHPGFPRRPGN